MDKAVSSDMHGLPRRPRYRTIWISDIHLGTRGCKADYLLEFLRVTESRTLYLVGDIFDGWRLKRSWFWPQSHNDVVQKLLRKARKGTRLIYVPGNHDEALASGLPVIAFPVPGPLDVVDGNGVGVLKEDLHEAALAARKGPGAPLHLERAREEGDEMLDERETREVAEA